MQKHLRITLAALCFVFLGLSAKADILVAGTTFDVYLSDFGGQTSDFSVTVGTPLAFTFENGSGFITDTETVLSPYQDEIQVTILAGAGQDLYPAEPGNNVIAAALGPFDPLKLAAPFDLATADLLFENTTTGSNYFFNVTGFVSTANPFGGSVPGLDSATDIGPVTDIGINEVQYTLISATPEPSSFLLLGTGVLALAGAARRRFVKA